MIELEQKLKKTWVFMCVACLTLALAYTCEATAKPSMLDSYALQISAKVKRNFTSNPEWETHKYSTTARIKIDQKGRLLGVAVTAPSGNRDFDNAVVTAIRRSAYFGPPPVEGLRMFGLRFDSKTLNKS